MNIFCGSMGQKIGNSPLTAADRRNRCAGICVLLCLILYAFFVDPEKFSPFSCIFRNLTGLNCFACGLTHSFHAAARLEWMEAAGYHLFGPVLFLSAWAVLLYWILELVLGRKSIIQVGREKIKTAIIAAAVAWLIYWLLHLSPGSSGAAV